MGKQKDWSIIVSVFLYVHLTSEIYCTSQTHSLSGDIDHFNVIRRLAGSSLQKPINGLSQQKLKNKDLIKKMFGQPSVSFKQYGGYVNIDESAGRSLYYYFVESVKTSVFSPLIVWFNGGPACSSLSGAFLAHGPFRVHSDGKTLYRNPYSWNNEANVLYIESPTQVGFSYTNTPSTEMNSKGDKITAEENYAFLVKWLERFPEYKRREIFIGTQSYGGHYGPQLAQIILQRNNQTFINLQGVLLGNPSLDEETMIKGNEEYLVSHDLVPNEIVAQKNQICKSVTQGEIKNECSNTIDKIANFTNQLNTYNIYASVCLNSALTRKPKKYTTVTEFDPCSANYMTAYLNMEKVQNAMHANTTKLQYPWRQCNDILNLYWVEEEKTQSMLPILHEVMKKGVRILVFSGDTDAVVSVTATMYALKQMNLTVEKQWRPWFSQAEVGGYTEQYKENLMFATVRGAGHSVSSDQPIRALTLFTNFIRNTPLPHS